MAQMFSLSDNESETSEEQEDLRQTEVKCASQQMKHSLTVPHSPRREQLMWQRKRSMNEEDLLRSRTGEDEGSVGDLFRRRSRSAPPALWAAKKYGRQLRRMSDEFDVFLSDKDMKKEGSAGTSRQMRPSSSWFAFLWSHKES